MGMSDGTLCFTVECVYYASQISFGFGELISNMSNYSRHFSVGFYILHYRFSLSYKKEDIIHP